MNVDLTKYICLASSLTRMSVSATLLREPHLLSGSDLAVVVSSVLLHSTAGSLSPVGVPGRRSLQFVVKTHLYIRRIHIMEHSEEGEQSANPPVDVVPAQAFLPSSAHDTRMATTSYVYALGRITPRFPSLAVEKEFAQATGRAETSWLTDRQALQAVLLEKGNRYLARQLCWVLTIEGLETYILRPRDPADLDLLVEAIRPAPSAMDVDVVIGVRGPIAPPDMCNGLVVPIVVFDQIYSFDRDSLVASIPRPESILAKQEESFRSAAGELFDRIIQMAVIKGDTDEGRAQVYLAVRYPYIYTGAAEAHGRNASLSGVTVHPSSLSGTRNIVDVIFSYTNRTTDVTEKFFVRVDVTEEFPFLVTKLSPYYDR
jgi:PatG C-terminal